MGNSSSPGQRQGKSWVALKGGIHWMMTNSLVLYVMVICAQRIWTLLNSDVVQLIRRM
jgi:hypothetical protein